MVPLIMFYGTLLGGPKGEDRLMPKLRHINKEKDFLEWARKRRNLKNQLAEKPDFPRCPACVGLCEAFVAGVRKRSPAHIPASVGPFLRGVWKDRIFSSRCGSARQVRLKSHTQIRSI